MQKLSSAHRSRCGQRGGLFLGIIIGLLIGLVAALAVAIYVTKVPAPFSNRGATKNNAEQDAQEAQKNKNWDPNAPLYGKNPSRPAASGTVTTATAVQTPASAASAPANARQAVAKSADPLGNLAKAKAGGTTTAAVTSGADPFTYFVQVGAFRTQEDAEAQKAKLSMAGFETKITEREQSGRTVYRVRVGPMDKKEEADKSKEKLDAAGIEAAIVRVQR